MAQTHQLYPFLTPGQPPTQCLNSLTAAIIIQDDTGTMHDIMQTLSPQEQVQLANSCRADYQTTPVLARVLNDLDPDNKQGKVEFLLKYGAKIHDSHRQPGESSTIQDQKSESESESESEKSEPWVMIYGCVRTSRWQLRNHLRTTLERPYIGMVSFFGRR